MTEKGGKLITKKSRLPGIGTMAAFNDTEGNISIIIEPEPMD